MALFTQKSVDFDYNSAELVFFYIDDYTIFKKQGFCFHPQYELIDYQYYEKDFSLVNLKRKIDFVDLFNEENVNVKILCGRNGSGKSTLLEIMAGTKNTGIQVKKFCILRDKNGVFASSVKCRLTLDNYDEPFLLDFENYAYDFYPSDCCVNHKNMQIPDFDFRKNIVKFYSETPELYDGVVDGKLFTNFSIELWNFDNEVELMTTGSRKNLYKNENLFELKSWLKSDILSYFFLHNFQDNTYDDIAIAFEKCKNEDNIDLASFLNDNIYTTYAPNLVDKIRALQKELLFKTFLISEIQEVEKKIFILEEKILNFIQVVDGVLRESHFIGTELSSLLYFKGFSDENKIVRYLYDLSDGEWRSLKYRYEILHSMIQSNGIWWYIDEPEAYLHPEWCRTFINDYMNAYKGVKKYIVSMGDYVTNYAFNPDKKFTLIFATHSPFLLSDLTNDYIIYLEKKERQVHEIKAENECFAGNIGQMYNANFFMVNTIGEFARQKILQIINTIDSDEVISDEEVKKWELLVSKIGDDLLRNLIKDKIELDNKQKADANSILSKFTTYSGFSSDKEVSYKFTSIIGVKICPYCNIEYTYTVYDDNGLPVFRPDIDHFIPKNPKTGDPSLQLNLMNLVPSCMICNERLKRDKPFSRENNIHPYFDDFDNIMDFHINISDTEYLSEENFEINLDAKEFASNDDIKKAYNNISIFKLKERYQFHKNTVVDLFKRITFYNSSKQNEILEIIGKKDTINISFLFPEKNCDINNTSLGKLKKDIINLYLSI